MLLLPGSSEEALVGLINEQNALAVPLEVGGLYYGNVKSLADGSIELPSVTMYSNEDYEGYARWKYRRINFDKVFGGVRPIIQDLGQTTIHRLLPILNKRLGLNLQPIDIINEPIDWLGGNEQANLVIKASPNSLGYEGTFVIQFIRIRPLLEVAIAEKELDVLSHHNPLDLGKPSLDMATWGLDFSYYSNILGVAWYGWTNWPAVQKMFIEMGFPDIPVFMTQSVKSYSTKDVPEANQDFTNVCIQTGVDINGYKGDAYIHFNRS